MSIFPCVQLECFPSFNSLSSGLSASVRELSEIVFRVARFAAGFFPFPSLFGRISSEVSSAVWNAFSSGRGDFVPSGGIAYRRIPNGLLSSIHVLTVDPNRCTVIPFRAEGDPVSRETVATLARRFRAAAAVNGGFWKADGTPAGALKIAGCWLGMPVKPRGAIGWSVPSQKPVFDQILTRRSEEGSVEVLPASNPPYTTSDDWNDLEHIVGGTPVLVRNGIPVEDFGSEKTIVSFLVRRHARTAVGVKENGDWIFVVADKRFYRMLGGMTMDELASLMRDLGCKEAVNLDGGGSSTLFLDGKVYNEPCGRRREDGKDVEAVSDAVLIFSSQPEQ